MGGSAGPVLRFAPWLVCADDAFWWFKWSLLDKVRLTTSSLIKSQPTRMRFLSLHLRCAPLRHAEMDTTSPEDSPGPEKNSLLVP